MIIRPYRYPVTSGGGLADHFTHCEKAMQALHDHFTHCEKAVQALHSHFTHCDGAMQALHSHFTHCEKGVQPCMTFLPILHRSFPESA